MIVHFFTESGDDPEPSAWMENINRLSGYPELRENPESFSFILVSDGFIRGLNSRFRAKDKPTDVLTFPAAEEQDSHEIYISRDTALRQAAEHGVTPDEELTLLAVHGLLHAIGMDHEISEEESIRMRKKEKELLENLGLNVEPLTN